MSEADHRTEEVGGQVQSEPTTVVSPADILEHLVQMTASLERVWSDALENDAAISARKEAKEVWTSFTVQLVKRMDRIQRHDEKLRLSVLLETFPLDDPALQRLSLEPPEPRQRYHQLQIAVLYALEDLGTALNALDHPSNVTATFDPVHGTKVESWWEAGAFALIRRRARALARILRTQEQCLKEVIEALGETFELPNESLTQTLPWFDALTTAGDLVNQGHCEAALPQLLRSIRLFLAHAADVGANQLPIPLAPTLLKLRETESMALSVQLLETASERIGRGSSVELGATVTLARELYRRIQFLAIQPLAPESLETLREATIGA